MLVLTRKHGQAIMIGDGIQVMVLAISGGRVKLGVVAPAELPVHRDDVQQKMHTGQWPVGGGQCRCRAADHWPRGNPD
jgi:carbon storage regulator